jgi:cytochrome P450
VAAYDPFAPAVMRDPMPFYRELRDAGPVHPLPQYDAFALPRFAEVWQILRERDRISIHDGPIFARERMLAANVAPPSRAPARPMPSFSMVDPPTHTRLRRALVPPFVPGAVATLESAVRAQTREVLDVLVPQGSFDAVHDLASPVATVTMCRILGLPAAEHPATVELVHRQMRRAPGTSGMSDDGRAAQAALHASITAFVAEARGRHALVDALVAAGAADGEPLTDAEVAVQLGTLLVGGVETLPKIVAGGLLRLHRDPDQRAALVADPSLVGNGFEEIMRTEAVLQWVGRTLFVDLDVAGTRMRAGQRVFLLLVSANHDEREFADPERFDVRRPFPRTLVFGHGTHFCIGAHVARLEGRVLLEEVLARIPDYGVDTTGIEKTPSEFQVGYVTMPVRC